MVENSSSTNESKYDSEDWRSWSPEAFLAVLMHELRTPVLVIRGYTDILSDEQKKELHPQAIRIISNTTEKLMSIVDGIADYRGELERREREPKQDS